MKNLFPVSSLLICGAVAASLATSAYADKASVTTSDFAFKFPYDRTELDDARTAERLLVRLEKSVRRHCDADSVKSVQERAQARTCIDETMRTAMAKFGSSTLTQVYQSRAAG